MLFCFPTRLYSARGSREFSLRFFSSSKPNDEYYQRIAIGFAVIGTGEGCTQKTEV